MNWFVKYLLILNLQALHLDNNRIETVSPQSFSNLKNLVTLDLSNNFISLIDERLLSNLFSLKNLFLDRNEIKELDTYSLKNLTSLQDLVLAKNAISVLPSFETLQNLVTLDIGENPLRIESITNTTFSGLTKLYGLRMVDAKLTGRLPAGFCLSIPSLRVFNAAENRFTGLSPTSFSDCPQLRVLRLDSNRLEEITTNLASQLPSLLWLNVSANNLKWIDHQNLPKSIEWLDLSYNVLQSVTLDSGKDTMPSLRVLDISHNLLSHLDYTIIPPALETLRASYNQLKHVAPDTFSRATRLRRVELTKNNLAKLPLSALRFPPVSGNKPPPEFYLGGNPFLCDCEMEWLTRVNTAVGGIHPRIVDLDAIVCKPTGTPPLSH